MLSASSRGFTVVELMIAVTVIGVLLVAGVPAMRGLIENGRIRTAAESWKYGLALARTEAVRLNTRIEFVSDATGWQVLRVADGTVLHQASGKEVVEGLEYTIAPDDADRVTYDSLGRVLAANPSDGSAPITQVDVASAVPPNLGSYRPLRLQVLGAGVTRLCDPAVADTDSRACL